MSVLFSRNSAQSAAGSTLRQTGGEWHGTEPRASLPATFVAAKAGGLRQKERYLRQQRRQFLVQGQLLRNGAAGQGIAEQATAGITAQPTVHTPSIPRGTGDTTSGQTGVLTVMGMAP